MNGSNEWCHSTNNFSNSLPLGFNLLFQAISKVAGLIVVKSRGLERASNSSCSARKVRIYAVETVVRSRALFLHGVVGVRECVDLIVFIDLLLRIHRGTEMEK